MIKIHAYTQAVTSGIIIVISNYTANDRWEHSNKLATSTPIVERWYVLKENGKIAKAS
jgi:hypothetical protein